MLESSDWHAWACAPCSCRLKSPQLLKRMHPNPESAIASAGARRISQREVARAAGVSQVAVSLALRGHPSLPAKTRARIQAIAKRLGYTPDPALGALVAYRNANRPSAFHSTLAWLNCHGAENGWKTTATVAYHAAACERASELGYKLETFWLRQPRMTSERLASILRARNVAGIILPPQPKAFSELVFDWSRFVVVTLGLTLAAPAFHTVASDHFSSMRLLVDRLLKLGYKRPGLVLQRAMDDRVGRAWSGGFLAETVRLPGRRQLPVYLPEATEFEEQAFLEWFEKNEPDVVVTLHREVIRTLQAHGHDVPGKVGVAFANVVDRLGQISGIDENSRRIGRAAVDILGGLLQQNDLGVPTFPMRVLVEGTWAVGGTTRS